MKYTIFFITTLLTLSITTKIQSQEVKDKEALRTEIMKMDSLLFQAAFNQCDLVLFKTILSEHIEFYDDRSGLNTSLEKEIKSFVDKCSKPYQLTRKLSHNFIDKLGDFGAVQIGEHEFLIDEEVVEKAKFVTIWERKNDTWIVKRAISYDHQPTNNE